MTYGEKSIESRAVTNITKTSGDFIRKDSRKMKTHPSLSPAGRKEKNGDGGGGGAGAIGDQ